MKEIIIKSIKVLISVLFSVLVILTIVKSMFSWSNSILVYKITAFLVLTLLLTSILGWDTGMLSNLLRDKEIDAKLAMFFIVKMSSLPSLIRRFCKNLIELNYRLGIAVIIVMTLVLGFLAARILKI